MKKTEIFKKLNKLERKTNIILLNKYLRKKMKENNINIKFNKDAQLIFLIGVYYGLTLAEQGFEIIFGDNNEKSKH